MHSRVGSSSTRNESHQSFNDRLLTETLPTGPAFQSTKARFEPLETSEKEDVGWGVIRLYRDSTETPDLYDPPGSTPSSKKSRPSNAHHSLNHTTDKPDDKAPSFKDEDCRTLCILAVPIYLTPSDFLGFVGEKTRDEVSHFRFVRTDRGNRYCVLMKFRNGKKARGWRRDWNGRSFDGMEPENIHVVFVKSITISGVEAEQSTGSFPDMRHDPFTPSITQAAPPTTAIKGGSRSSKPAPPPTPALVELPTCPVCLERMDESTGLLTILCQHVFHCSCLQKWRGSGCPVCRYTQDGLPASRAFPYSGQYEHATSNECQTCHADTNLWICLICGHVGCGRYDLAHAFSHYESSGHCFAMDMDTQRVWDYARDAYVHRILQDKHDGKFVELDPGDDDASHDARTDHHTTHHGMEMVPQQKLDSITMEYTSLLTSQLESQRAYYEDVVARTADKAASATSKFDVLASQVDKLATQLSSLQASHTTLTSFTIPTLERDLERERKRADMSSNLARNFQTQYSEEKEMNKGMLERAQALQGQVEGFEETQKKWEEERVELNEQNRDLMMFLEGQQKVRELDEEGGEEGKKLGEEIREGFVEVGEGEKGKRKGRKGKGRR